MSRQIPILFQKKPISFAEDSNKSKQEKIKKPLETQKRKKNERPN